MVLNGAEESKKMCAEINSITDGQLSSVSHQFVSIKTLFNSMTYGVILT